MMARKTAAARYDQTERTVRAGDPGRRGKVRRARFAHGALGGPGAGEGGTLAGGGGRRGVSKREEKLK